MACGVLEVKRVKVSEGGRDILGVKIFIVLGGLKRRELVDWCYSSIKFISIK
jgi:hypothetical protein